ncbi:glycosyltransferase family 4 protein [Marinilabilia salmonicolor]|uniref:Glycosyltransferase involved in cell wall biosynthesis n=1 Tax=Marinilabilia salmonicolor TaxID=989 RepID=A0A368UJ77_9BACT|nr:glycosyltransferase family 4 protein [Marinilabilia salmonicolor]RCW27039.1 glycosyltransferase involved in cell wall biosynthesis [Marinilabilia salmonicolor]
MRIALLTDGIYPHIMGGMQKHSYYLAKFLARAEVKVDIYHAIPEGQPLPTTPEGFTEEELQNLKFFPVHFPKPSKYPGHYIRESYIYSKRIFRKFIQQPQPDFVYIQGFSGWKYLARRKELGAWGRIKTGINFHGVEMFQQAPSLRVKLEHLLLRPWVKWNLRLSDIIFSLGGKLTHIQKKLAAAQNRIIEMPIGITNDWLIDEAHEQKSKIRKFAFIGRYERRKGIEELHSVLQQLMKENQPFEFHFIGPIPKSKHLTSTSLIPYSSTSLTSPPLTPWPPKGENQPATKTSNNLLAYSPTRLIPYSPTRLVYHGPIHDEKKIQQILRDADVLVCPSWSEGMPTVILEAMASGCAIIASDVGAVSEQVDSNNGILIEPGNKNQLKNAMITMLNIDEIKLLKMKKISVDRIKEKFLWEQVAERTIQEIKRISV